MQVFKIYILLIILLQLSQFFLLCLSPSHQHPYFVGNPPPPFMSMGHVYSPSATQFTVLFFTSPWLFGDYRFVLLNALTSSPFHTSPSHLATIKTFSAYDLVSVLPLFFCLFFLASIAGRCIFIAILLFIF